MRNGFAVFFAVLIALGGSWLGFVVAPAIQLGKAKQAAILNSTDTWPLQRTGEATLGLQVYRANGCAACHTEQIQQSGVEEEIMLTGLKNSKPDDFKAFVQSLFIDQKFAKVTNSLAATLKDWKGDLPATILITDDEAVADSFADLLQAGGLKFETHIVPTGPDIPRWGVRRSVAADFLYDQPVQLGGLRVGPDLAAVGARLPDANWQLLHLYAPGAVVKNSAMPSFKFLFEVRKKVDGESSSDALNLPKEFAPTAGYEIVPKPEAKQLAAYLLSLRADAPLYEAPFTSLQVSTNAPAK
jgi:cbb3-type cytochrome oxidase cytochrome c subunit